MPDMVLNYNATIIKEALNEKGYEYLKTRVYKNTIVVYSEYNGTKENRFRFIHNSNKNYSLGMSTYTCRWELTAFEGTIDELLSIVTNDFNWILTDYSD